MPVTQDVVGLLSLYLQLVQLLLGCNIVQQRRFWTRPKDLFDDKSCLVPAFAALQMLMVLEILLVPNFLFPLGEPPGFLLLLRLVLLQPFQTPDDVLHVN